MNPIYEAHQLSKQYRQIQALDNLDLTLMPGRLVGLLGPNGSGKTTLIKISAGLLTPTSGSVSIDGHTPGPATKAIVSYLPDRMALPSELSAADAVSMYADFFEDFYEQRHTGKSSALPGNEPGCKALPSGRTFGRCGPCGAGVHSGYHPSQL